MKIAHVATFLQGGAAIAARRLHAGLLAVGVESRFYGLFGRAPDATYALWGGAGPSLPQRAWLKLRDSLALRPSLHDRPAGFELFSHAVAPLPIQPRFDPAPDVVHLHWVGGLDLGAVLAAAPADTPIVWTLHDMHPLTGGCHYAMDCVQFTSRCDRCPQLSARDPLRLAAHGWARKRAWLAGRRLHVVADSTWLEGEARRSGLLGDAASLRTIHYGLDTACFAPRDRSACRQALGLSDDDFVVGFAADSIGNQRKGLRDLLAAAEALGPGRPTRLLAFGSGSAADLPTTTPVTHLGFLAATELQALAYGALDVFAAPSLAEAFGQTALESSACARPVVAYAAGGLRDAVVDGVTGLLAPVGDVAALRDRLDLLRRDRDLADRLGRAGRSRVAADFTLENQAAAYRQVYVEALARPLHSREQTYVAAP